MTQVGTASRFGHRRPAHDAAEAIAHIFKGLIGATLGALAKRMAETSDNHLPDMGMTIKERFAHDGNSGDGRSTHSSW